MSDEDRGVEDRVVDDREVEPGVTRPPLFVIKGDASAEEVAALTAVLTYSGMLPCFFGGSVSRLLRSTRSARTICTRVSDGAMTESTYPRSAAT